MKQIYYLLFMLFVSHSLFAQNKITSYEYWFNDSYSQKQSINISPVEAINWQATLPCEHLENGMHTLNFRFKDTNGNWSAVKSSSFFKTQLSNDNKIIAYEYWIDDDSSRKQVSLSQSATANVSITIPFDDLATGIYCFNIRFKDTSGNWSSVKSQYFFKSASLTDNKLVAYEYWINDDYDKKISGSINDQQSFVIIDELDVSKINDITNTIHFRFKDKAGQWSSIMSKTFHRLAVPQFTYIVGLSEVTFANTSKYASDYLWDFGDGNTTTQVNPLHIYGEPGAYLVKLIAQNDQSIDSISHYVEIEGIKKITNTKGGNNGLVSTDIYGGGLNTNTVVKLVKDGEIISTYLIYQKERGIICATFDLTGKSIGVYDIVISINGKDYVFENGFEIEEESWPEVFANIEGNNVFIPGRWQTYTVNYGNLSNTDVYGLPINLIFSDGSDCEFAFDLMDSIGGENSDDYVTLTSITSELFGGRDILDVYSSIHSYSDIVSLSSEEFNGKMYSMLIPHIPANTSGSFSFRLNINNSSATKMYVNTGEILNDIYFNAQDENIQADELFGYWLTNTFNVKIETLSEIIRNEINKSFTIKQTTSQKQFVNFVTLINTSGCFSSANNLRSSASPFGGPTSNCDFSKRIAKIESELVPNGCGSGWNEWFVPDWIFVRACETHDIGYATCGSSKAVIDNQFLNDMCQACINTYPANEFKRLNCIIAARKYYDAVVDWGNSAFNDAQRLACEKDDLIRRQALGCPESTPLTPQISYDPNEIIGTLGYGNENYITQRSSLNYTIYFENDPDFAAAPAQEIFLTDTLDLTVFDPEKFSFSTFTFRNITFEAIPGVTEFSKDIDMSEYGENITVRVSATFDKEKGIINWHLIALDPVTMDLTESPFLGILYPNNEPPIGEGNVTYTIGLREEIGDGDVIKNQGYITFDLNEPIATNIYTNIIDESLPQSSMRFESHPQNDLTYILSWNGSDQGSGIRNYTIYMKEEGEEDFSLWLANTTETSAEFTGKSGKTYHFYCIATDNVGNKENVKAEEDITINIGYESLNNDATLTSLTVSVGMLEPAFDKNTTEYTVYLCGKTAVDITGTASSNKAEIKGNVTGYSLIDGENIISLLVTAEDGVTTETYTVTVILNPESHIPLAEKTVEYNRQEQGIDEVFLQINGVNTGEKEWISYVYEDSDNNQLIGLPVNAGVYKVTATYTGSDSYCAVVATSQLTITQKAAVVDNEPEFEIEIPDMTFTGNELTPMPVIINNGYTLIEGIDYDIETYVDNINAGTGKVIITFKGNYSGTFEAEFDIEKADPNIDFTETAYISEYGETIVFTVWIELLTKRIHSLTILQTNEGVVDFYLGDPSAGIKLGSVDVVNGVAEFHLEPNNPNYPGIGADYPVVAVYSGNNNLKEDKVITSLTINAKSIADMDIMVEEIPFQIYTENEIKPEPAVMHNGLLLQEGVDYTLTYADNIEDGIATITISGINNYTGSRDVTFEIVKRLPPNLVPNNIVIYLYETGDYPLNKLDILHLTEGSTDFDGSYDNLTFKVIPAYFDCTHVHAPVEVAITATDSYGLSTTKTAWITVKDDIAPIAVCQDIAITLDSSGQKLIFPGDVNKGVPPGQHPWWANYYGGKSSADGSYDACGIDKIFLSKQLFTCADIGENLVTLTVYDPAGNSSTCQAIVTVFEIDSGEPVKVSDILVTVEPGVCETSVDYPAIPATEATATCGTIIEFVSGLGADGIFPLGITTETWKVTNSAGFEKIISFDVTVETHNAAPAIDKIENIEIEENTVPFTVELTGISYGIDCLAQQLTVTVESDNAELFDQLYIDYTQGENTADLYVELAENISGEALISITVKDDGGTEGGNDTVIQTFTIIVKEVVHNPVVINAIEDIVMQEEEIEIVDLNGVFEDKKNELLTLAATLENGDELPAWITFNATAGTLILQPVEGDHGEYTFTIAATNESGGSVSTTFHVEVKDIDTGIDIIENDFAVKLYPNPTDGKVTIELTGVNEKPVNISVYTLSGVKIFNRIYPADGKIDVDMDVLPAQTYLVEIKVDGKVEVHKLIVK